MSDRVEQAARVIAWALADRRMDRAGTVYGLDGAAAAQALDAAGMLAPHMRQEWGIRWPDGNLWPYPDQPSAEGGAGDGSDEGDGTVVRRFVTGWEEQA